MVVSSINSQTALNLGRAQSVGIETNKINFHRNTVLMLMKVKLHQEETLPDHQKKFAHKKNYGMPDQLHDMFLIYHAH